MGKIRHVSFDLWMTLIRSHPSFKTKRAALFRSFFSLEAFAPEKVEAVFRETDVLINNMNEITGRNVHTFEMYLLCLHLLGIDIKSVHPDKLEEFYSLSEALFFQYAPLHLYEDTTTLLAALQEQGITTNLLSNTGFIQGRTLRKLMAEWGWDALFAFQLYSDETGYSKPDAQMFNRMLDKAASLHTDLLSTEVWHLGDNQLADVQGAQRLGITATLTDIVHNPLNKLLNERCLCLT
ncbi:putative hydrolase of the HAD superfamily [Chitinophaga sp. YR627]|uniref:HAD family hydrolase n=1 Tax=Chitinophaga sp. YR627 TaxID=1881041 RepID=UPI0008E0C8CF|nr:HAD family hydrolase [Chitinophaga sp. YR627]SFN95073.1 putative hydrolase of the HAD superfamily [Chitinophaga sp. YR627]